MRGLVVGTDPDDYAVIQSCLRPLHIELTALDNLTEVRSKLGAGELRLLVLGSRIARDQASELMKLADALPMILRPRTVVVIDPASDELAAWLELAADLYVTQGVSPQAIAPLLPKLRQQPGDNPDDDMVRRIAQSSPNIIYLFDLAAQKPIYVNRSLESILGYTFEALRVMGPDLIRTLVHPDDLGQSLGNFSKLTDPDDVNVITELRLRHANGTWRWMRSILTTFVRDDQGLPIQLVGTLDDITDRKEAEAAVVRAQKDFREVIENIPDFVVLYRASKVAYVNSAGLSFFGFDCREDVLGRDVFGFIHPDDHDTIRDHLNDRDLALEPREVRIIREDGDTVWVEVVGGRNVEFEGGSAGLMVIRDISQRKRIQSRLMLADRMVSVGTLAAGVAHEINNPLSYVIGNLAYLSEQFSRLAESIPAERRSDLMEAVQEAREGAERVRVIVSDLRTFSREDDSNPRAVDIHAVLDSTLNIAANDLRSRAHVVKDYQPVPYVRGNAARLGQVVLNLMVNAAQAIPEGRKEANEIRLRTYCDGPWVVIEVSDTGGGIPSSIISRIFDPFFTTKPVGIGTGLGLSICHNIVESLGGELSVESTLGVGTTFRVSLPRNERDEQPLSLVSVPEPLRGQPSRILIIDDDPIVARAIERALSEQHDVVVADGADRALELCRREDFHVVFCDVLMPGVSGMEFYERIKRDRPGYEQRVVFITAGTSNDYVRAFFEEISNERLTKPFDIEELRTVARTAAERVRHFDDVHALA